MRAIEIIETICEPCRSRVHPLRFAAVTEMAAAVFRSRQLTLTGLGRALRGAPKHDIKRADRLVGSARLARELPMWFSLIAWAVVGCVRQPAAVVDWTQLHGEWWALVAAVPFKGRAVPIYAIVARKREMGREAAHARFLMGLRRVLPAPYRPILVADAGFRTPFFLQAKEYGCDFVIRIRNPRSVAERWFPDERVTFKSLFAKARQRPKCLGRWVPYATARASPLRIVISGRRTTSGSKRGRRGSVYHRTRAREPWLLATSLPDLTAKKVARIYALRMQIEETFRDAKSSRFGWALDMTLSRSRERLEVLLLLASLACAAALLVGNAIEQRGIAKLFQANTTTHRRVLSLVRLGRIVLSREAEFGIERAHVLIDTPTAIQHMLALFDSPPPRTHRRWCADCRRGT